MHRDQTSRDAVGAVFGEEDVAASYHARPPYAPALFEFLLSQVSGRRRALDLGCGPGNVAIVLADPFDQVVALDPSAAMLAAARAADGGRHPNIAWVEGKAEAYDDDDGFDLVTAGTSIHWPDHAVLFPRLSRWTSTLAIISNAELQFPCGEEDWLAFLKRWLAIMAERTPGARKPYDPVGFAAEAARHEAWMDIAGRRRFAHVFRQSVEGFIFGQHSAATWSRAAMGEDLAARFDAELDDLLRPHTEGGLLELRYVSELTWGAPRPTPR